MAIRIGQGFDVHAFCEGDHVMLGGVRIPHERGLKAHSDGYVALHALADALLGALALGDIGHYFPDHDERWRGADSAGLLRAVMDGVSTAGWRIGNLDLTVICQAPKLADHIARRFDGRGEARDDLVQVARVGLVNAVIRFDVTAGSDFVSFAVPTIMGEVRRHFRDNSW